MLTETENAAPLNEGELLIPCATPAGPCAARMAWARAIGDYLLVDHLTFDGAVIYLAPQGGYYRQASPIELAKKYERPSGLPFIS